MKSSSIRSVPPDWPEDLWAVFSAIRSAMGPGRLAPSVLNHLPTGFGEIVPGHFAKVSHVSKKALGDRSGRYLVELSGDRWNEARWWFVSGQLEQLARQSDDRAPEA